MADARDDNTPRPRWRWQLWCALNCLKVRTSWGESGPGHETLDIAALERSVSAARDRGCAVFVKQDSGPYPGRQGRIPDALWARKEFPRSAP